MADDHLESGSASKGKGEVKAFDFKREEKRSNQRKAPRETVPDPLMEFSIPKTVRKASGELDEKAKRMEERKRKISAMSDEAVGSGHETPRAFVKERENFANDAAALIKASRAGVDSLVSECKMNRKDAGQAKKELEASDRMLLKERAVLATNKVRVEYGILAHPSHARLGEAYLAAVVENLQGPARAAVQEQGPWDSGDQANFRARLIKNYCPLEAQLDPNDTNFAGRWCPVTGTYHDDRHVKAAHIVPYSIGEGNAAYLFGLDPETGYEAMWSSRNGLILHEAVEEAMDTARMVIVPDPTAMSELQAAVLDPELLRIPAFLKGPTFEDLDGKRLQFRTAARPGRRYLYLNTLLTLFRRKRFCVNGWEEDMHKMRFERVWASPGPWLRRSIIKALAYEIGDAHRLDDLGPGNRGLVDFPDQKSPSREASMAIVIRRGIEVKDDNDDDDEWATTKQIIEDRREQRNLGLGGFSDDNASDGEGE